MGCGSWDGDEMQIGVRVDRGEKKKLRVESQKSKVEELKVERLKLSEQGGEKSRHGDAVRPEGRFPTLARAARVGHPENR
jgi:murein L,D-transpeptidase YafK